MARLRESFQFCETALAKVDDKDLGGKVLSSATARCPVPRRCWPRRKTGRTTTASSRSISGSTATCRRRPRGSTRSRPRGDALTAGRIAGGAAPTPPPDQGRADRTPPRSRAPRAGPPGRAPRSRSRRRAGGPLRFGCRWPAPIRACQRVPQAGGAHVAERRPGAGCVRAARWNRQPRGAPPLALALQQRGALGLDVNRVQASTPPFGSRASPARSTRPIRALTDDRSPPLSTEACRFTC